MTMTLAKSGILKMQSRGVLTVCLPPVPHDTSLDEALSLHSEVHRPLTGDRHQRLALVPQLPDHRLV